MMPIYAPPVHARRSAALALTLLVHLVLIVAWQAARTLPAGDHGPDGPRMQWIDILPLPERTPPPPKTEPERVLPAPAPASRAAPPSQAARALEPAAPAAAPVVAPDAAAAAPAPSPVSAFEMLQQAKRSVGKIDQDLRKAHPGQPITAPVSNGATRLSKGIEDAAAAAPNKWYQAPKVTEIIDPGPYGRRRYRVVGAFGTYCITVESNHAPDGIDQMQKGIQQKTTTCDEDEQAPTRQTYK